MNERWELVDEEVSLYSPEVSRVATPDEFLETEDSHHTIIAFRNVLVGCKQFENEAQRDDWISRHPMGKRIELRNPLNGQQKAGNIIEIRIGSPPDDLVAAIMIYIERAQSPDAVHDWVI